METKKFRKQHVACKIFAIATVVIMGVTFIACSSDDDDSKPIHDSVKYVDLGLPSGLKWATCNIGATKPEEYGDYYAWGETDQGYLRMEQLQVDATGKIRMEVHYQVHHR